MDEHAEVDEQRIDALSVRGMNERRSSGFARNVMMPRKKASTRAISPVLKGAVCFNPEASPRTATTDMSEKTKAMKRSDPALPA